MAYNVNSSCGSDFYGRITMDADIPTDNINHYKTSYRIMNASFRQKLYPVIQNILRRENPLELVFDDISTFDAQNLIVTRTWCRKKDIASELIKKARPTNPPFARTDYVIQNRLNRLKSNNEYFNKNNGDGNNGRISPQWLPAIFNNFQPPSQPPPPPTFHNFIPLPPLQPPPPPPTFNNFLSPPSLFNHFTLTEPKPSLFTNIDNDKTIKK